MTTIPWPKSFRAATFTTDVKSFTVGHLLFKRRSDLILDAKVYARYRYRFNKATIDLSAVVRNGKPVSEWYIHGEGYAANGKTPDQAVRRWWKQIQYRVEEAVLIARDAFVHAFLTIDHVDGPGQADLFSKKYKAFAKMKMELNDE